jgi:hypothetical protein
MLGGGFIYYRHEGGQAIVGPVSHQRGGVQVIGGAKSAIEGIVTRTWLRPRESRRDLA